MLIGARWRNAYPEDMNSSFVIVGFGLLPILGGIFGFGGCIIAASMIESRNTAKEPILSYGQQFGLISLPICTMIGAAIGVGFHHCGSRSSIDCHKLAHPMWTLKLARLLGDR